MLAIESVERGNASHLLPSPGSIDKSRRALRCSADRGPHLAFSHLTLRSLPQNIEEVDDTDRALAEHRTWSRLPMKQLARSLKESSFRDPPHCPRTRSTRLLTVFTQTVLRPPRSSQSFLLLNIPTQLNSNVVATRTCLARRSIDCYLPPSTCSSCKFTSKSLALPCMIVTDHPRFPTSSCCE